MKKAVRKREEPSLLIAGVFARKEGAKLVAEGHRHVHSSSMGDHDPLAVMTAEALVRNEVPVYPWERPDVIHQVMLTSSQGRQEAIKAVAKNCGLQNKRQLRERLELTLEELLTNAVYHAYRYPRQSPAQLSPAQQIKLSFGTVGAGVWINVRDAGGILRFESIAESFARCYGASEAQIAHKEGGAGLGLYMVYEMVSHLKVEAHEGKWTGISVWLVDGKHFDPKTFSFNFFQGGK